MLKDKTILRGVGTSCQDPFFMVCCCYRYMSSSIKPHIMIFVALEKGKVSFHQALNSKQLKSALAKENRNVDIVGVLETSTYLKNAQRYNDYYKRRFETPQVQG